MPSHFERNDITIICETVYQLDRSMAVRASESALKIGRRFERRRSGIKKDPRPSIQGEDFVGVSTGIEAVVFVVACFSNANSSLSVESTRVEFLVKIV